MASARPDEWAKKSRWRLSTQLISKDALNGKRQTNSAATTLSHIKRCVYKHKNRPKPELLSPEFLLLNIVAPVQQILLIRLYHQSVTTSETLQTVPVYTQMHACAAKEKFKVNTHNPQWKRNPSCSSASEAFNHPSAHTALQQPHSYGADLSLLQFFACESSTSTRLASPGIEMFPADVISLCNIYNSRSIKDTVLY